MSRSYVKHVTYKTKSAKADKRLAYKRMRSQVRDKINHLDYEDVDENCWPTKCRHVQDVWDTTKEYRCVDWDYDIRRDKSIIYYESSRHISYCCWYVHSNVIDMDEFVRDSYKWISK